MKILALEFYNNGFMREAFAFGGSAEKENIDQSKNYESSLQNYLIDTGKEVILVDTGVPVETPEVDPQPGQMIYQGKKVNNFVDALKNLGYEPKDVDKVIVTHKHPDHTGELRLFNHAKIYISEIEADAILLGKAIDGVYSADPKLDKTAVKYDEITYAEVLQKDLKVMDSTSTALCKDNNIPLIVFGIADPENIVRAVRGEKVGTIVK